MDVEELRERMNNDNLYHKFDGVPNPRSRRSDLHAMMLLDELVPSGSRIVSHSAHDEYFLEPDIEELAKAITPDQVDELVRCGVRISEYDALAIFS